MTARHTRTVNPNAPRMAPTAIKTVPWGRLERCMKGAWEVGGTAGGGYVGTASLVLDRVGSPVTPAATFVLVLMGGRDTLWLLPLPLVVDVCEGDCDDWDVVVAALVDVV